MSDPLPPRTAEPIARRSRDGRLSPWADPVTGAPGWQITTRSRRLALAVATIVSGGTVRSYHKGEWQARLPEAVLTVTALGADAGVLRCHLSAQPSLGVFALAFAPWPATLVLGCPLTALPAHGQLSVSDVRLATRMGRTVRYLIPAFTTP
jgi:hypothetical protein